MMASILSFTQGTSSGASRPLVLPRGLRNRNRGFVIPMKRRARRAVVEIGFIIFLFYSNLLMGEFERSGMGVKRGVVWAIEDVFTLANFEIAATAGLIGYVVFEFLQKRF